MSLPLAHAPLPPPPPFRKLIGPSFIILGLGLGSGEIILWPYLTSNHGLGIVWAIVVGITIQFFINLEVERYALIYGESIFVGFTRWLRFLPYWFIISTFLGFGWPGIGLAGATLLSQSIPLSPTAIAIVAFIGIGLLLSVGKMLYKTVESLQKLLILIGTPAILLLTIYLARPEHWQALISGLAGVGPDYVFLPAGLALSTFLSALVYSGAGGNLNLTQGNYIKDKGYGMGAYADKIQNLFTAEKSHIKLTGSTFPLTAANLSRYRTWWRLINLEHGLIFWFLGLVTMLSLAFLAYITTYHQSGNTEGIMFVLNQSGFIAQATLPAIGIFFLLITGCMLTATQLTVLDSTSRIISENLVLTQGHTSSHLAKMYYLVLWFQIFVGIGIMLLGFSQPRQLITISAVINAFTMFVYILLLVYVNNRRLPAPLRPHPVRSLILILSSLLFGTLFVLTLRQL